MSRRAASGFTLLETIVTLVVVALIVVVLMQALQQALGLRTRLLRHERDTRMSALQEQWFRDSVSSAIADLPDALGRMDGSPESLELVSAAPLSGHGLGRIRWTLQPVDGGHALEYSDEDWPALPVVRGPLRDARFAYMDAEGEWHDEWKPGDEAPREDPATAAGVELPRMVRLQATTTTGELLWLVPILAAPEPTGFLRPEELGVGI
ncbi:MAG: hypothetical protein M3Y70_08920 [Pseudomonadota bacterium]|nr:hypothetical protein [Pseudomonadota bacterium]